MEDEKVKAVMGELTTEDVRRLHDEARALRMSITHLTQTAAERRRKTALTLAIVIWFTIWGHDQHVESCVVDGPRTERTEFICDVTFPLHNHSADRAFILGDGPPSGQDTGPQGDPQPGSDAVTHERPESSYPVNGNALGMLLYLSALGLGIRWAYKPRSRNEL